MTAAPLKGTIQRCLFEEEPRWEEGIKTKKVAAAVEWLKENVKDYSWLNRQEIYFLLNDIDEAFADVIKKEESK